MSIRTILVPTGPGVDVRPRLDAALRLSRAAPAHVRVIFFSPDPGAVLASLTGIAMAIDATLNQLKSDAGKAAADAEYAFQAWCADNAIPTVLPMDGGDGPTSASFAKKFGDVEELLAIEARLSDLIVLDRPDSPNPFTNRAFDAAVFSSARISLVVSPHPTVIEPLDHVLIAWNDSLEVTRAIAQAMPLLKAARYVSIFAGPLQAGEPAAGLQDYLRWHGIPTLPVHDATPGKSSGERILASAQAEGVGMILMGAYTHSRARQFFLGGVTQHLLAHSPVPLLMAH
ncbi:universal stress protein [Beijerinckia sp. L45]|uniref:universal stress protein n=1 Tax=Beijerinckia sp. L45 TaxID=1641855 RepID=UPI00131E716A|nr:universal stress protein [Beijerinckia sp. L45]